MFAKGTSPGTCSAQSHRDGQRMASSSSVPLPRLGAHQTRSDPRCKLNRSELGPNGKVWAPGGNGECDHRCNDRCHGSTGQQKPDCRQREIKTGGYSEEPTRGSCLGASSPDPNSGPSLTSCSWFLRSFNSVPSLLLTYWVSITGIQKNFHEGSDSQFTERLHMLFCLDSVSHATPGRGQGGIITYILWPKKPRQ